MDDMNCSKGRGKCGVLNDPALSLDSYTLQMVRSIVAGTFTGLIPWNSVTLCFDHDTICGTQFFDM